MADPGEPPPLVSGSGWPPPPPLTLTNKLETFRFEEEAVVILLRVLARMSERLDPPLEGSLLREKQINKLNGKLSLILCISFHVAHKWCNWNEVFVLWPSVERAFPFFLPNATLFSLLTAALLAILPHSLRKLSHQGYGPEHKDEQPSRYLWHSWQRRYISYDCFFTVWWTLRALWWSLLVTLRV